eukprot:3362140-Pleurochrysis_carterae.AAC.3
MTRRVRPATRNGGACPASYHLAKSAILNARPRPAKDRGAPAAASMKSGDSRDCSMHRSHRTRTPRAWASAAGGACPCT